MAFRTSLESLATFVRSLIGDPISTTSDLSQETIAAVLDRYATTVKYLLLRGEATLYPSVQYLDFYADIPFWEETATLAAADYAPLVATTKEPMTGHWAFAAQPATAPTVYVSGTYFDVYAAAADLVDMRIAALAATAFDFTSDGQSFRQSQIITSLQSLAARLRSQATSTVTTSVAYRSDVGG